MKSFYNQYRECKENNSMGIDTCPMCEHKIVTCKRLGGICKSSKCLRSRLTIIEKIMYRFKWEK